MARALGGAGAGCAPVDLDTSVGLPAGAALDFASTSTRPLDDERVACTRQAPEAVSRSATRPGGPGSHAC